MFAKAPAAPLRADLRIAVVQLGAFRAGYLFRDRGEVLWNCSAAGIAIVEHLARAGETALLRAKSLLASFPFAVVV